MTRHSNFAFEHDNRSGHDNRWDHDHRWHPVNAVERQSRSAIHGRAHDGSEGCPHSSALTRRGVLVSTAGLASVALAGCFGDDVEPAEPVDLTGGWECTICGMIVGDHDGPAGQWFGADDPDDEPAAFDSVVELRSYHDQYAAQGEDPRGVFVTDYSSVDYDIIEYDDATHISTHLEAEAFVDATVATYVVDSHVYGAMGPDYIPFSADADADAFTDEHAGDVQSWDDLGV